MSRKRDSLVFAAPKGTMDYFDFYRERIVKFVRNKKVKDKETVTKPADVGLKKVFLGKLDIS